MKKKTSVQEDAYQNFKQNNKMKVILIFFLFSKIVFLIQMFKSIEMAEIIFKNQVHSKFS